MIAPSEHAPTRNILSKSEVGRIAYAKINYLVKVLNDMSMLGAGHTGSFSIHSGTLQDESLIFRRGGFEYSVRSGIESPIDKPGNDAESVSAMWLGIGKYQLLENGHARRVGGLGLRSEFYPDEEGKPVKFDGGSVQLGIDNEIFAGAPALEKMPDFLKTLW